ncbi:integrin alpha [Marinicella rhabdoformis]|uniref:integrin alpha n=1 Tax=Marinicella rhabdoformis TaxID=2580566 RepID=UPI001C555B2F|nr:integrin alpha [Marinicella rhabdoformis]
MIIHRKKIVFSIALALGLNHNPGYGQAEGDTALIDLNGSNGITINGVTVGDGSGGAVSDAGDFNGDGFDDVIIGASSADPGGNSSAGSSYVVFGSENGLPNPLNLEDLNGLNGIVINGANFFDYSGVSVSAAGDVNGDGNDDVIIGADDAESNGNSGAGISYVVFGSVDPLPNPLNLYTINGINGFSIHGSESNDRSGHSVRPAGDVNGDGLDDIIVGAFRADPNSNNQAGSSYVVFGSDSPFPNPFFSTPSMAAMVLLSMGLLLETTQVNQSAPLVMSMVMALMTSSLEDPEPIPMGTIQLAEVMCCLAQSPPQLIPST